ncbi:hypothetical protein B0H19DRAFT_1172324 [Mycena capillaripes]|nr:hypothetical protein B0H19DRAFT_1172324 [Mycena capillaripes]
MRRLLTHAYTGVRVALLSSFLPKLPRSLYLPLSPLAVSVFRPIHAFPAHTLGLVRAKSQRMPQASPKKSATSSPRTIVSRRLSISPSTT